MGALRTGEDDFRALWQRRAQPAEVLPQPVGCASLAHAGSAMLSATPILPEQGSRPDLERMQ